MAAAEQGGFFLVEVFGFKGVHYDFDRIGDMSKVLSPPYDVISREYRDELRKRHPNNCIHLILGEELEENKKFNLYTKAAENFTKWLSSGILKRDEKNSIYVYEQIFSINGKQYSRKAFIALVKLEDLENGAVKGHERTLGGPKADRLELLRATKANFSSIFSLYEDSAGKISNLLQQITQRTPVVDVVFDDGVRNKMWIVNDPLEVKVFENEMKDRTLFIADGHHRYETALLYKKENPQADKCMMTLVELNDSGLIVLPTHRLIYGLEGFDFSGFVEKLRENFDVQEINGSIEELKKTLSAKANEKAFIARSNGKNVLFSLKKDADLDKLIPGESEEIRDLDVTILHELVIEGILGLSKEMIARKEKIEYVKDFSKAIEMADSEKFNVAFLMNATKKSQVVKSCLAGQRMPQKSTYFYPKIITGLVFNKIDEFSV